MEKTQLQEAADTHHGGTRGFVAGAVLGAIVVGVLALILDVMGVAHGGMALSMAGGAGLGGLIGLMYGALSARRRVGAH